MPNNMKQQSPTSVDDLYQSNQAPSTQGRGPVCKAPNPSRGPSAMGGRVDWKGKLTTKRTKALKTPAAKVPKNKKCDDDALEKDWKRSYYCTMIKIEPFSIASAAGRPQDLVYCEIRHETPIRFRVRGGHADAMVCPRSPWVHVHTPRMNDLEEENDGPFAPSPSDIDVERAHRKQGLRA